MMENMKINQLPSKTWNWLKMNETAVSGISVSGAHEGNLEIPAGITKTVCPAGLPDRFKDVAGGMGSDIDMLIRESAAGAVLLSADSDVSGEPARIRFAYGAFEHSLNTFGILAKEGSNMTVIMDMAAERSVDPERTGSPSPVGENPAAVSQSEHTGLSAVQTKLILEKDAKVTLVQIIRNKNAKTVLNDIGAKVADGAKLSVIHLFLGGDRVYNGCKAELIGKKSNFTADIAYTVADDCVLDMNYVALHEGKKSVSEIRTDGVLHENARKLFRGTIDFKKGAAGAVGNEKEDVLLLDDDVVNQTIPLILCAEEDVEGNHGATIGKLDEDLVFYLESRGMALAEIYKMMAKARIDAVLRFVPDEKTKADVAAYLESEGSNGCE